MKTLDSKAQNLLWFDPEPREELIRRLVYEALVVDPPTPNEDAIIASYFFAFRTLKLDKAVKEIAYHATSGAKNPPVGSLLAACTAQAVGVTPFDSTGRIGMLHIAFPLKMMLQPDDHLTTCDIFHTVASAIIFDVYENLDAKLVRLTIPEKVVRSFPGPAYGPAGIRRLTGFATDQPAFGTILKPTAGITPEEVENLVSAVAACKLFLFVKEDEDLYPNLEYSPVKERTKRAVSAIERSRERRDGLGLLFAPHISGAPHEILDTVHQVVDAGATAVMLSESFAGGTVRMVREATRHLPAPPAIYGHNAGIGVKTRGGIYREVIDLLARLDGIDFRQTAPVRPGKPFIKPYGDEWKASEEILSCPIPGIKPTMIARAGALDQGNIGLNLEEAERRGIAPNILFLAGSAINSIKNLSGVPDPSFGAEGMLQAIDVYHTGEMRGTPAEEHLTALAAIAHRRNLTALIAALHQRYPDAQLPSGR